MVWPRPGFSGKPGWVRSRCQRHMPTGDKDAHPRTRTSQEPTGHQQNKIAGDGRNYSARRSSGLRFQFFCVEVFSFFPKCQRNGCDLACERKACHGWLDALGDRGLIKLLEWSGSHTRSGGHSFEQTFEIVVVIFIEAANGKQFL